jgi:FkbM family methyltransferase
MVSRKKHLLSAYRKQKIRTFFVGAQKPSVYLGHDRVLTQTVYGHSMFLHARDVSLTPSLLMTGRWEREGTNAIIQFLKPDMHVVEVGANVGYFSVIMADLVGAQGSVTSFEANPVLCEIANRNLQINGQYYGTSHRVHAYAVTDFLGKAELSTPKAHLGSASLYNIKPYSEDIKDENDTLIVTTTTLDDFIPKGQRVDFLKIDAEGSEPNILLGARRVLSENPAIRLMIEYSPAFLKDRYNPISDFLAELSELGFKPFEITRRGQLKKFTLEMADALQDSKDLILMR